MSLIVRKGMSLMTCAPSNISGLTKFHARLIFSLRANGFPFPKAVIQYDTISASNLNEDSLISHRDAPGIKPINYKNTLWK